MNIERCICITITGGALDVKKGCPVHGCNGGYACAAPEHIEGCFTGEGDPYAVTGLYIGRLRAALGEAEATLRHIQPYVGLLVQYLPDATRRVAAAREKANAALSGPLPRTDQTKEDAS